MKMVRTKNSSYWPWHKINRHEFCDLLAFCIFVKNSVFKLLES